jgi:hypothetical protein
MELTITRWGGWVARGCAAFAALALPAATHPASLVIERDSPTHQAALARARGVRAVAARALTDLRVRDGLSRWRTAVAPSDTAMLRIDGSVPPALRDGIVADVHREWSAAGGSAERAAVFVYVDTAHLSLRALKESYRPFDLYYVLPEATGGTRCLTLVRLRDLDPKPLGHLLGLCGFYARVGAPGTAVREWLERTSFASARSSNWDEPRPPVLPEANAWLYLSAAGSRCLTRGGAPCLDALGVRTRAPEDTTLPSDPTPPLRDVVTDHAESPLGDGQPALLADVMRELGPERFAAFWRGTSPVTESFRQATGVPLEDFTQQWLMRRVGLPSRGPRLSAGLAAWLAAGIPMLVLVGGLRGRESVTTHGRSARR